MAGEVGRLCAIVHCASPSPRVSAGLLWHRLQSQVWLVLPAQADCSPVGRCSGGGCSCQLGRLYTWHCQAAVTAVHGGAGVGVVVQRWQKKWSLRLAASAVTSLVDNPNSYL